MDELNKSLIKFGVHNQLLSVDEAMVPYYGRHGAKMFIRGKPIRFGYKIWCLVGENGFPYHLKVYTGKEPEQQRLPLGTRIVDQMVSIIEKHSNVGDHHFFFDNFFISYSLLKSLAERNVKTTGTIRENRTNGTGSSKQLKKTERGTYDFRCDGNVYICKWNDNAVVSVATNYLSHLPLHQVRRRVKKQSNVKVPQPHLICSYNEGMGGVDLMGRLLASCRPMIRGKKWYWPLFVNLVNISLVAAWRLHCCLHDQPMSHLDHRRQVTLCLLKIDCPEPRAQIEGEKARTLPDDVRFDGQGHEKQPCSQGRCKVCQKNARYVCRKCKVRLHYNKGSTCAVEYPTPQRGCMQVFAISLFWRQHLPDKFTLSFSSFQQLANWTSRAHCT